MWWCADPYDANMVRARGTCFFVTIGATCFGVTAFHVIAEFLRDRDKFPAARPTIGNIEIGGWEGRCIDGDAGLDVATFRVADDEFRAIGVTALHSAPEKWPPDPPTVGRGLVFTSYPGVDRRVLDRKPVEFVQSSNGVVLAGLGPEELEVTIDPAFLVSIDGTPIPPTTKSLGGYSGAPVLIVSAGLATLFWLGGIVIRQWPAKDETDTTRVWARRPNCIRGDGTLIRPSHAM